MTQVASNAHRVEIIAPVTGNNLASVLGNLSAGQWGTVTVTNQMNTDPGHSGDSMFSYSPQTTWDELHNVARFLGGCHGSGGPLFDGRRFWACMYTDATNSWATPIWNDVAPIPQDIGHGYYAGAVDQQTGDFYCQNPFAYKGMVRKLAWGASTWTTPFPDMNHVWAGRSSILSCTYHPGLYGGQGGLVVSKDVGIWSLNPRAASPVWNIILDRVNEVNATSTSPFGVYDRKTQCMYCGGYDGNGNLWRIPASSGAGTPTTIPLPAMGAQANGDYLLTPSGNPANNMVIFNRFGAVEEFNGSSWVSVSTSVPATLLSNSLWAAGPVPLYGGGIMFPRDAGGFLTATAMQVWKR